MGTKADDVFKTANKLTGNPIGMPGADLNMVKSPTDIGHYAPVTKAAAAAGTIQYFGGAPASGTGAAGATMPAAVPAGTATGGTLSTLANTATILAPITSLAAAAGGITAARRAQAALNVPEATPAPSFGGPNTILASRAETTEQLRRRGRASTILTSPGGESLGAA